MRPTILFPFVSPKHRSLSGATPQKTAKQAAVLSGLFALFVAFCQPALAQISVPPLGVTPIEVQHTPIRPGSRLTDQFVVTNGGSVPMFVSAYTADWTIGQSGAIQFQEPGTNSRSCASWIQIVPPSFSIPSKGEVVVRYTITTPADLTAEHHALIFFESRPLPSKGANNMNLMVAARIGCKVFVEPVQPLPLQGKLTGIGLMPAPDNKLAITFENTGLGHLRASGSVEARDANGQVVAKANLLPHNVQMLSGTSVSFTPKWDTPLAPGTYTMRAVVDYGGKTLVGGEAKVEIPVAPPNPEGNKPDATEPALSPQANPDVAKPVANHNTDNPTPLPTATQQP